MDNIKNNFKGKFYTCAVCKHILQDEAQINHHSCVQGNEVIYISKNNVFSSRLEDDRTIPNAINGNIPLMNESFDTCDIENSDERPIDLYRTKWTDFDHDEYCLQLIQQVKIREQLWHLKYKFDLSVQAKNNLLWKEIEDALPRKYTWGQIKKKWKGLVSTYRKICKYEKFTDNSVLNLKKNSWRFYDGMSFMKSTLYYLNKHCHSKNRNPDYILSSEEDEEEECNESKVNRIDDERKITFTKSKINLSNEDQYSTFQQQNKIPNSEKGVKAFKNTTVVTINGRRENSFTEDPIDLTKKNRHSISQAQKSFLNPHQRVGEVYKELTGVRVYGRRKTPFTNNPTDFTKQHQHSISQSPNLILNSHQNVEERFKEFTGAQVDDRKKMSSTNNIIDLTKEHQHSLSHPSKLIQLNENQFQNSHENVEVFEEFTVDELDDKTVMSVLKSIIDFSNEPQHSTSQQPKSILNSQINVEEVFKGFTETRVDDRREKSYMKSTNDLPKKHQHSVSHPSNQIQNSHENVEEVFKEFTVDRIDDRNEISFMKDTIDFSNDHQHTIPQQPNQILNSYENIEEVLKEISVDELDDRTMMSLMKCIIDFSNEHQHSISQEPNQISNSHETAEKVFDESIPQYIESEHIVDEIGDRRETSFMKDTADFANEHQYYKTQLSNQILNSHENIDDVSKEFTGVRNDDKRGSSFVRNTYDYFNQHQYYMPQQSNQILNSHESMEDVFKEFTADELDDKTVISLIKSIIDFSNEPQHSISQEPNQIPNLHENTEKVFDESIPQYIEPQYIEPQYIVDEIGDRRETSFMKDITHFDNEHQHYKPQQSNQILNSNEHVEEIFKEFTGFEINGRKKSNESECSNTSILNETSKSSIPSSNISSPSSLQTSEFPTESENQASIFARMMELNLLQIKDDVKRNRVIFKMHQHLYAEIESTIVDNDYM